MHRPFAFVLLSLPLFAAASPAPERARGFSIPIEKRSQPGVSARKAAVANTRNSLIKIRRGLEAYERNTGTTHHLAAAFQSASELDRRATASEPLTGWKQQLWYGEISVGTPAVTYLANFDTGSADLFLPNATCGSACFGHTPYDPSKSSTAEDLGKTFFLGYEGGSIVRGEQYTDTVTAAGLTATKQTLGAANSTTGYFSETYMYPDDGLLGMSFPAVSGYNANPFFHTLIAQGTVSSPVFGFKLAQTGASLYLGGLDDSLYTGAFTYSSIGSPVVWEIALGNITVNGQNILSTSRANALIDTGTSLIVGDAKSVAAAYSTISGAVANDDGTYTVPCDAAPSVSLTFGGKAFPVSPATFVLPNDDGTCIGGLSSQYGLGDVAGFWVVGDVFLQNGAPSRSFVGDTDVVVLNGHSKFTLHSMLGICVLGLPR